MKDILGTYYIADCEHRGDIERAKSYINSIGGKVLSSHWDGYDCGEAYLEISLPIDVFKKVYKDCSFQMDADINDYIKSENIDDKKSWVDIWSIQFFFVPLHCKSKRDKEI